MDSPERAFSMWRSTRSKSAGRTREEDLRDFYAASVEARDRARIALERATTSAFWSNAELQRIEAALAGEEGKP